MCTAIVLRTNDTYFGRTLDHDFSYGEQVVITPRNFVFKFKCKKEIHLHYAFIGMAHVNNNYPLYYEAFNEKGIKPTLVYGARDKDDLVLIDRLNELCNVYLCTDDGSYGYRGNVVKFLSENSLEYDYYYACGPHKMLEALAKFNAKGCVSLEARMGCGFGACMGCSIETINGPKRVCKEGPVFEASEVIF